MASVEIHLGDRVVGGDNPTLVVAELSGNHSQHLGRAIELIDLAAEAGADAVKIQTYRPDTLTIECDREPFVIGEGTPWAGRSLFELYEQAHTPWEWTGDLETRAREHGMLLFSTPFDESAVDFLEHFDLPAYKIASFELTDLAFIERVAACGRPLILSTGMATIAEIDEAVTTARAAGAAELALLRCSSAYPANAAEMDLRSIPHMLDGWDVVVGLSDHTLGCAAAIAAVALGARIVEKHFVRSRSDGGPDADFSLEPHELRQLIDSIREAEASLGDVRYGPTEREKSSLVFRRSLFAVEDVTAGQHFTVENVRSIRPGGGLAPKHLPDVIGRRASCDIERGTPLTWDHLGA
ncbi:MAG: Pseudaminic acid synthase [Acidimicrobiales bacterium]|nr:Pseudaminic acid synthase [Acidimicrobiales bacterium]